MDSQDKWFSIGPAWGDSIVCYINAINHPEFNKNRNVIFYPAYKGLTDFFVSQGTISTYKELDWGVFLQNRLFRPWFNRNTPEEWTNTRIKELVGCSTNAILYNNHVLNQKSCVQANIPHFITTKIHENLQKNSFIPEKYILIQPYSFNSAGLNAHWPHWEELINSVLKLNTPVVLVGLNYIDIQHHNLYNLSGCLTNMSDIFCLSQNSLYTITTSNALSLFVVCNKIPSVILKNNAISSRRYTIWRQYIDRLPIGMSHDIWDPIETVKSSVISMHCLYGV